MPRYYSSKKNTTDNYSKTLSIYSFKRDHFLKKGLYNLTGTSSWTINGKPNGNIGLQMTRDDNEGNLRVYFSQTNTITGEKKELDYIIRLTTTPCHIGNGRRWWFICPCGGNRCAKLYLQNNGIFASRKTLNLSYESRNKSRYWRYLESVFGLSDIETEKLRKKIHFPYRNGKPTRKMKSYLKKTYSPYTDEQLYRMECELLTSGRKNIQWS